MGETGFDPAAPMQLCGSSRKHPSLTASFAIQFYIGLFIHVMCFIVSISRDAGHENRAGFSVSPQTQTVYFGNVDVLFPYRQETTTTTEFLCFILDNA